MKLNLLIIIFILSMLQAYSQKSIEYIERIYKEKDLYYTFIEPIEKTELWYRYFIQFDSLRVINKGHVNMVSGENFNRARKW
jgi:hypothetical protein